MKILEQPPNVLVIKKNTVMVAVLGAIFVAGSVYEFVNYHIIHHFPLDPSMIFLGGFFIFGLIFLGLGRTMTFTFDKSSGQAVFVKRRLIGSRTQTYPIASFSQVKIKQQWRTSNNNRGTSQELVYTLILLTKEGQELELVDTTSPLRIWVARIPLSPGPAKITKIGERLAGFLGIPFSDSDEIPGIASVGEYLNVVSAAIHGGRTEADEELKRLNKGTMVGSDKQKKVDQPQDPIITAGNQ